MRCVLAILVVSGLASAAPALAGYPPSDHEQYMLEVINRMRLNPDGEVYRLRGQPWGDNGSPQLPDLNEGITSNLLTDESRQPLAFSEAIIKSARDYSQTLLDHDDFQHNYNSTTPQTRMSAAGYTFTPSYSWGENLALTYSTGALLIDAAQVNSQYNGLFIDGNVSGRGHRRNLLSGGMKEIGIGIVNTASASYTPPGRSGNWFAVITTQDFAFSSGSAGGNAFLTGVVFSDGGSDNNFYDAGEGFGGVTVTATPVGGGAASSTSTWSSGGYSLALAAGAYNVTLSGGSLPNAVTYANVTIGATNVKLDASSDLGVWNVDANGDWSTGGNWSGTKPNGSGTNAMFAGKATASRTISLTAPQTVGSIGFKNTSASYLVSGAGTLTMQLAGDRATAFVHAGSHTIATPVSLLSGLDVTVLGAGDSLTFSGPISNVAAQSLTKLGKGTLRLSGNNSFSGGLTVSDGTVVAGHNSALGSAATTLGYGSNDVALLADAAVNVANAINVAAGPGGTRTLGTTLTSGTATFGGPIALSHDLIVTAPGGGTMSLSATVSGNASVTKTGAGKVALAQNAAYTGNTSVLAGILELKGLSNNGTTTVGDGTTTAMLFADYIRQTSLVVRNNGKVTMTGGGGSGGTSVIGSLTIALPGAGAGQIDGGVNAVPEPSALALLLATGCLGLLAWRRRLR